MDLVNYLKAQYVYSLVKFSSTFEMKLSFFPQINVFDW